MLNRRKIIILCFSLAVLFLAKINHVSAKTVSVGQNGQSNKIKIISDSGINPFLLSTSSGSLIISGGSSSLLLKSNSLIVGNDFLFIDNSGSISVGTSSINNRLNVNGTGGGLAGITIDSAEPSFKTNTLYRIDDDVYWNTTKLQLADLCAESFAMASDTAGCLNDFALGTYTRADGGNSFSGGYKSKALGRNSLSFGSYSTSTGENSFSFGNQTISSGANSLSLGLLSRAIGLQSFALGENSLALGENSVAFGSGATSSADNSFAFGFGSQATGNNAISGGENTQASANSFAIGQSTLAGNNSLAVGNSSLADGNNSLAAGTGSNAGGDNSLSIGSSTVASNNNSVAFGVDSKASGENSWASGNASEAVGESSFVSGDQAKATGKNSMAIGLGSNAKSYAEFSAGENIDSSGNSSSWVSKDAVFKLGSSSSMPVFVVLKNGDVGLGTLEPKNKLHVEGVSGGSAGIYINSSTPSSALNTLYSNTIIRQTPHSYGDVNSIMIDYVPVTTTPLYWGDDEILLGDSFADSAPGAWRLGEQTKARGKNSFVSGYYSEANGDNSFAVGIAAIADKDNSFAVGNNVIATGTNSIAMGHNAYANADYSIAIGNDIESNSQKSTVMGSNNVGNGDPYNFHLEDPLFEIGNGPEGEDAANALTVMRKKEGGSNVGIGTANPTGLLHLYKISGDSAEIDIQSVPGLKKHWAIYQNRSNGYLNIWNKGTIGGGNTLSLNTNGNIAIGQNFYNKLTVDGQDNKFAGIYINSSTPSSTANTLYNDGVRLRWGNLVVGSANALGSSSNGLNAVVFGTNTVANGDNSIAMGNSSVANGANSFSMNASTTADGMNSVSAGSSTISSGSNSFSAGEGSKSDSYASVAIGRYNVGGGNALNWNDSDPLFEIGNGTESTSSNALVVLKNGSIGIGKDVPNSMLDVFQKNIGNAEVSIKSSKGNAQFKFDNSKWKVAEDANGKLRFIYYGYEKVAMLPSGNVAIGFSGNEIAENKLNIAGIDGGFAGIRIGNAVPSSTENTLYNAYSSLFFNGQELETSASSSGVNSMLFGLDTNGAGDNSLAIGEKTSAFGLNTIASGYSSYADGRNSIAAGDSALSLGENSIALGNKALTLAKNSISLGDNTQSGYYTVTNNDTWPSGENVFTAGDNSKAQGKNSFASGQGVKANYENIFAIGQYNTSGNAVYENEIDSPVFQVGNGQSSSSPSRALTVFNDGSMTIGTSSVASGAKLNITGIIRQGSALGCADTGTTSLRNLQADSLGNIICGTDTIEALTPELLTNSIFQNENGFLIKSSSTHGSQYGVSSSSFLTSYTDTDSLWINEQASGTVSISGSWIFSTSTTFLKNINVPGGLWLANKQLVIGDNTQKNHSLSVVGTDKGVAGIYFNDAKPTSTKNTLYNTDALLSWGDKFFTTQAVESSIVRGPNAIQMGTNTQAIGANSLTSGDSGVALGMNSIAMGSSTMAYGTSTVAFGYQTMSSGENSFAIGSGTTAMGNNAFVSGSNNMAIGENSVAFGDNTSAFGDNSLAIGSNTVAKSNNSFAAGDDTSADAYEELAIGQYNVGGGSSTAWISKDAIFEIGNGDSDTSSNAFTVLKNGNVGIGTSTPNEALTIAGGGVMPYGDGLYDLGSELNPFKGIYAHEIITSENSVNIGNYKLSYSSSNKTFKMLNRLYPSNPVGLIVNSQVMISSTTGRIVGIASSSFDTQGVARNGQLLAASSFSPTGLTWIDQPKGTYSINGLSGNINFVFNTSAGSFNIATSGENNLIINLPESNSITRGLVSSSTWLSFNNKVDKSLNIIGESGLAGGGNLSANRILSLNLNNLPSTSSIGGNDFLAVNESASSGGKKITKDNLVQSLLDGASYQGVWDGVNNDPALADGVGTPGYFYVIKSKGSRNLGSGTISFNSRDFLLYNSGMWQFIPAMSNISSVFGRKGDITGQNGDYNASQIINNPTDPITSTNIQEALNELALNMTEKSSQISSGTVGQIPFYANDGDTLSATSSLFTKNNKIGLGITDPVGLLHVNKTSNSTASVSLQSIPGTTFKWDIYQESASEDLDFDYRNFNKVMLSKNGLFSIATSASFIGDLYGNASTTKALSNNGSNCPNGYYPKGFDQYGNAEDCVVTPSGTLTSFSVTTTASELSIGNWTVTSSSGVISFDLKNGHTIPTATSVSNWEKAYESIISSATAPIIISSSTISINKASSSADGYLSSQDWNIFNAKLSPGDSFTGIVQSTSSTSSHFTGNLGIGVTTPSNILEVSGGPAIFDNTPIATGGTITDVDGYRIHKFTSDGSFVVSQGIKELEVLVVGGGGSGGSGIGGGGGGGGYVFNPNFIVSSTGSYMVRVGLGGVSSGNGNLAGQDGQSSQFANLIAQGGGGGGMYANQAGRPGGSGGGGSGSGGGGSGSQGKNGANGLDSGDNIGPSGGGGGGGSSNGGVPEWNPFRGGDGGNGFETNILGSTTTYAGGGGGGMWCNEVTCVGGSGGIGGGGNGAFGSSGIPGQAGLPNTGGGGGGGNQGGGAGGAGGSGIVIVRYRILDPVKMGIGTTTPSQIFEIGSNREFTVSSNGTVNAVGGFVGNLSGKASTTSQFNQDGSQCDSGKYPSGFGRNLDALSCTSLPVFGTLTSISLNASPEFSLVQNQIISSGTIVLALNQDYVIPKIVSTTQWTSASQNNVSSALYPMNLSDGVLSIATSSDVMDGILTSSDWSNFNNKLSSSGTLAGLINSDMSGNSYITGGNLGIGTTTPNSKLVVDGIINASALSINGNTLSDSLWHKNLNNLSFVGEGNVGINASNPLDQLQIGGSIRLGDSNTNLGCIYSPDGTMIIGSCSSDVRFKKNIEPITSLLSKVTELQPVTYNWRTKEFPEYNFSSSKQEGLIAQEVEKVLPDMVGKDTNGYNTVNYSKLPLYLTQAIKELNEETDSDISKIKQENSQKIEKLNQELSELESSN